MALINGKNCTMGELVEAIKKSKVSKTYNFYVKGQLTEYYGFSAKNTMLEDDVVIFGLVPQEDGDTIADFQKWCKDNRVKRHYQVVFNGFGDRRNFPYVEGWLSIEPDNYNHTLEINVDYWPLRK